MELLQIFLMGDRYNIKTRQPSASSPSRARVWSPHIRIYRRGL